MHGTPRSPLWLLLAFALVVPACEAQPGDEAAGMAGETTDPATMPVTPPAAAGTASADDTAGDAMMASFQSLNGSSVTGEIRVEPAERQGQTRIVANVMGVPTQGVLRGHIHSGTCDAPGSSVTALESITTAANGTGEATSIVDMPIESLANGQHIVMYHEVDGAPGQAVACAGIPQR